MNEEKNDFFTAETLRTQSMTTNGILSLRPLRLRGAIFPPVINTNFRNVKGLYIHIPFCTGKCFYCAFYSVPYNKELAEHYLRALETELKQYPGLAIETVYFGGGTPSVLSQAELQKLCSIVKQNVCLTNLREWTVEANPESLTFDKLIVLKKAGVNRLSLGAQSFDNNILHWLGRRHHADDITAAVHMIHNAGFDNFGLDLIACVPGFSQDTWRNTLQAAVALNPKHISVYALTAEEDSRLAKTIASMPKRMGQMLTSNLHSVPLCHSRANGNPVSTFPNPGFPLEAGMTFQNKKHDVSILLPQISLLSEDEELEALNLAENILTKAGYRHYEISNYAKPGFECLHNLSCWRGREYIGLGPAAASHAGLKRWTNEPDLGKYLRAIENGKTPPCSIDILTEQIKSVEKIVFGLRMSEGISADTAKPCRDKLLTLKNDGLTDFAAKRWRLTKHGMNLADYVGAELIGQ
jgi:oxygen-independent coproporphyrinogen-3 oxidase